MANNNKLISGYFLLDKVEITEEVNEQLNQLKKNFLIEWKLLKEIDNRELYYAVMRDSSKIEDKVTELEDGTEFTEYGLLTVIGARNPEVLGVWKYDGSPLGQTKIVTPATYSEDGELITEEIIVYEGISTYPFNKSLYLSYMDDIVTYDEDGVELTRVKPTICKPIRLFAGFNSPIM